MSFSNPVAKSVGADGTAPGRVWESRLLPALIIPDGVGGVLCVPDRAHGHPAHLFLFCLLVCFVCYTGVVGWVCCNKGRWGLCRGLCGVVDVGDELLCFVDQGVAEESGTR